MYCEKCGTQVPDNATFCPECGNKVREKKISAVKEDDILFPVIVSLILPGLGILIAGNKKKGIVLFIATLISLFIGLIVPVCLFVGLFLWAYGLYETYREVKIANGADNPKILKDFKTWNIFGKIVFLIIVLFILVLLIVGIFSAFYTHSSPDLDDNKYSNSNNNSTYISGSSSPVSSGGDSYSSYSDGRDVYSHYEGDYGSSDTHGKVYDDGSIESHQKGSTDYGDYQIDSYMDSNGNLHGTVDVGGKTYYVDV